MFEGRSDWPSLPPDLARDLDEKGRQSLARLVESGKNPRPPSLREQMIKRKGLRRPDPEPEHYD